MKEKHSLFVGLSNIDVSLWLNYKLQLGFKPPLLVHQSERHEQSEIILLL